MGRGSSEEGRRERESEEGRVGEGRNAERKKSVVK